MKRIVITLIGILLSGYMLGQNIIDKHFSIYKAQDNFTKVHISSKAFELTAHLEFEDEDKEFEDFRQFLTTVSSFDLIAGREVESSDKKYQAALKKVQATHEELMTIDDKEGDCTFFIDESNGIVKELVMVGAKQDNLVIFSLTGNMDLAQLSKMSKFMNQDGENGLERLFNNGVHDVKVYPNPVQQGSQLVIEVPEDMVNGTVNVLNLNGALVKSYTLSSSKLKLQSNELASGNYILEFKSQGVSIKRKVVVR